MEKAKTGRDKKYSTPENIDSLRPSFLEINLDAFNDNFQTIKGIIGSDVALLAVVKANAYGHGLVEIGFQAEKCGADFLGVAFIEKLLEAGVRTPLVVLYPDLRERAARLAKSSLIATVSSADYLEALNSAAVAMQKTVEVFLKIETGMGRYGLAGTELPVLINLANQMPGIKIIGLSTNLANSNNGDDTPTQRQFEEFERLVESVAPINNGNYKSIKNSSGLLFDYRQDFNLVRVGLLLYGLKSKANSHLDFKPVMSLRSRIIQLKNWPAGRPVGYGGQFIPARDSILATVGIGYADGYPWSLSNKSSVLINGRRAKVVGKICMDAMMIDVTDIAGVKTGDEVVLMGRSGDEIITAEELADLAGSFPYEFLSGMSDRLPRIYRGG